MPKPTRGVKVELDKTRHLSFPLAAIGELKSSKDPDFEYILWLGLRHEDPDLTAEDVGQLVDLSMIPDLVEPLKEATGGLVDMSKILGGEGAEKKGSRRKGGKKARTGS